MSITHNDLLPYTDTTYQVWIASKGGARFLYRSAPGYHAALTWAQQWNDEPPADSNPGDEFFAVAATTSFERI